MAIVEELKRWFAGETVKSLAAVCGKISGGLLVLDFDVPGYFEEWRELAGGLPVQRTGGGGWQVFLRCPDPGRNVQLAWHPKEAEISGREVAIETRAEGGYVCAPPSLHPSGNRYAWVSGSAAEIPMVSQARANALLEAARSLDHAPYTRQELEAQEKRAREATPKPRIGGDGQQGSVIDAFNAAHSIEEMLERYGYTRKGSRYVRPGGKNPLTVIINGKSYHHSSDDILKTGHLVNPFDVFLAYEHGGSITDAVREAANSLGLHSRGTGKTVQSPKSKAQSEDKTPPSTGAGSDGGENAPPPPEAEEKRTEQIRTAGVTGEDGYHFTDTGCAKRLLAMFGDQVRYNEEPYGKWLWWNGNHWQFDTTNRIYEYVDRMVTEIYHQAADTRKGDYRDALLNLARGLEGMKRQNSLIAKTKTMQGIAVGPDDLDANPWLFAVRNGTVDLTDGEPEFREHRQEDYLTRAAPVDFDEAAKCPRWEKFLGEIFSQDAELIQFMQRAVGYSLTGDISEQCLFFAYGTGANGKTVFFNAIEMLLGEFFYRAPAEMILQQKNTQIPADVANLKGKRFVITSELEENRRLAEARVKSLTGGDPIEARKLYGDWFTFQPTHKLWMFGNHKPIIVGSDEGIWRRVKVIPFTVTIPEENRRPMRELLDEFREELAGILNWALEGYRRYREAGFNIPAVMKTAGNEYRSEMDILGQFILECAVVNKGIDSNGKEVWQAYRGWCEERGEHALAGTRFYQKLRERGFEVRPGHANKTVIYGLGLADRGPIG
jgi:putative DNA primase/helicase